MNRREEIIRLLHGKKSERIPRALYGAGRWAYRQAGLKPEDIASDPHRFALAIASVFEELDTDMIFPGSGLNTFPAQAIGGSLAFKEGQAPLLSFPVIQRAEDACYLESVDIGHSNHSLALIEMIAILRDRLPDRFLCATSWGPFTWGMILCDWNILKEKTATDIGFVREVCNLGVRLSQAFYEPLIARRLIDGIAIPDGAATLISNDLYKEVVLTCERKLFDWAKSRGVFCVLHQCGNIQPQLELYPATGADVVSVDASIDIGEVYKMYRGQAITAGNVDAINTILGGNPASICSAVRSCITAVADPYRQFILMPSCDIPPDTPSDNVRAFLSCSDSA